MSNEQSLPVAPKEFGGTNERGNDPWDHDAVSWMLEQDFVSESWSYHNLFECARKQRNRVEKDLDRVITAAALCGSLGVQQIETADPRIGKTVVRLRRTDERAPEYPPHYEKSDPDEASTLLPTSADREAARRLLSLIGAYEAELVRAGKTRATVHTYVDRAERFLNRIANG